MPQTGTEPQTASAPVLRIVRGEPSAEELAALVAVIMSQVAQGGEEAAAARSSSWTDRSRHLGIRPSPASGGWRASAFPH